MWALLLMALVAPHQLWILYTPSFSTPKSLSDHESKGNVLELKAK